MSLYRFQVTLFDRSGLPKDRYVNTYHAWHVSGPATVPQLLVQTAAIAARYQAATGLFGHQVDSSAHSVVAYDMSLPPGSRIPLAPTTFNLHGVAQPIPGEVAIAVTLQCDPVAGVEPMSTRGRVFFGPLGASALNTNTDGSDSRPAAAAIGAFLDCVTGIASDFSSDSTWYLCVASTVHHKVPLADGSRKSYPVTAITCDNAWDTIRSRGDRSTTRERRTVITQPAVGAAGDNW